MKRIGIIGCGWLGQQIADSLFNENHHVKVTTHSIERYEELLNKGLDVTRYSIGTDIPNAFISELDTIILCVPVRSSIGFDAFIKTLDSIHRIAPSTQLIFTSSTSVYANNQGITTEKGTLNTDNLNAQIEQRIHELFDRHIILRLGGLFGENRHPVHHLSGRKNIPNGNAPVNLIHGSDIVRVVNLLIPHTNETKIYNVVYPMHPTKEDYYTTMARIKDLPIMTFDLSGNSTKVVVSDALMSDFNFSFKYSIYPTD